MTRDELAKSLGYKDEEEWDIKLSDKEYIKYLGLEMKFLAKCYSEGNKAYNKQQWQEDVN